MGLFASFCIMNAIMQIKFKEPLGSGGSSGTSCSATTKGVALMNLPADPTRNKR